VVFILAKKAFLFFELASLGNKGFFALVSAY
jgi:hypothetical protein